MIYTYKDAANFCFREVRGGASPESTLVRDRINQALSEALKEQFSKGEFNEWEVATNTKDRELLLPPEIETAELVTAGSAPIDLKPQWYRHVTRTTSRQELEANAQCVPLELDDMGDGFVSDVSLDTPMYVMAIVEKPAQSSSDEISGQSIHLQGIGGDDRPVWDAEGRPGFSLTISDRRPKFSKLAHMSVKVKTLTAIRKPQTKWPVILYAYEEVTEAQLREGVSPTLIQMARLMPWEESISRRKYAFVGTAEVPATVRVFGRLRFRPLQNDNDILPMQDLGSIRQFGMTLEAEREGELGKARYHQQEARRTMDKGLRRHVGVAGEQNPIQIINDGSSGFGDLCNI